MKYADVPFTHSMGAAEYSVPIYELKGRRLTIPISLDYCSNGIKLDEIAGVAGLGWTLNAGGCITREVIYMLHDDVRTWLPYPATSGTAGSFRNEAASASASYHGNTSAYYGRTYEESSRNRVLKATLPGYSSHPDESSTNVISEFPMLLWRHSTVENNGNYSSGQLVAEVTEDADGRITFSVKDHLGRLLATKHEGAGTGWDASTRYVYDELDRLAAVIGAGIAVSDTLSMWRYGYDSFGRLQSKGVPGSVREYYTYDSEDHVITVTRGNELTEIDYDNFGRVTAKYMTIGNGARTLIEAHEYDSYSSTASELIGGSSYTSGPKMGLETWASFAITDGQGGFSGTANTAYSYDALGRLTRSVIQYDDGHKNTTVISYDFGARQYNPTLSRWLVPDSMGEKYFDVSPYVYCINNPISLVDRKGTDVFIVIWTTGYNNSVGHAGIAVSNYKKETYKEISNGVEITRTKMIPDGTYTFYDNWPGGNGVIFNLKGALTSVSAYRNVALINSRDEFLNGSTVSPSEGVEPNAVIIISTSYEQGKAVSEKLLDANREKSYYNGAWYNCSTYVSDGLKAIFGKRIGKESILGPIKSTTPNQLWKDVLLKTSEKNLPYEVLKDPGEEVDIRFIPYIKSQLSGDSLP